MVEVYDGECSVLELVGVVDSFNSKTSGLLPLVISGGKGISLWAKHKMWPESTNLNLVRLLSFLSFLICTRQEGWQYFLFSLLHKGQPTKNFDASPHNSHLLSSLCFIFLIILRILQIKWHLSPSEKAMLI